MSETLKAHERRNRIIESSFYDKYIRPFQDYGKILDIGFSGYDTGGQTFPNIDNVIGIDLSTEGYEGLHIPCEDEYFDVVYSSHMIEDVPNPVDYIKEHFRAVSKGGYLIYYLPHQWLYERKENPPSNWNKCHNHFYTPAKFLGLIEEALDPRSYRLRRCIDCDHGYDYSLSDDQHAEGEYSIEVVLEKIK